MKGAIMIRQIALGIVFPAGFADGVGAEIGRAAT